MSGTQAQITAEEQSELPHPNDDSDLRYTHIGKQFEIVGADTTFEIVDRDDSVLPQADGIIIIESDSNMIRSEHRTGTSSVSSSALKEHEPEAENKAVWTVRGHMKAFNNLRIQELDQYSYGDLYWE